MALLAALATLPQSVALGEGEKYYYNPQGGAYYHERKDCPTIHEKYWSNMQEITSAERAEGSFQSLKRCPKCFSDGEQMAPLVTPENPYSMHFRSEYDTADDVMINTAGTYRAGESLKAGIYTAQADGQCQGDVSIETPDKKALYRYPLQGEASYTFYLGEGMYVGLPEHCRLLKLAFDPQFQNDQEKVSIRQSRYMTMVGIPGRNYVVTNLQGENGYFVVSSMEAEQGKEQPVRVDVSNGTTVQLNLRDQYDVFVEFVNCVVWPSEESEG